MIETTNLRHVLEVHWPQMDFGEDADGEPIDLPIPRRFVDLTPEQYKAFANFYTEGSWSHIFIETRACDCC